jgi:hypothetical protein
MTVWVASIIWGSSKSCNSWRKGLRRRGALQIQCNSWHDCAIGDSVDMLRLQVVATVGDGGYKLLRSHDGGVIAPTPTFV